LEFVGLRSRRVFNEYVELFCGLCGWCWVCWWVVLCFSWLVWCFFGLDCVSEYRGGEFSVGEMWVGFYEL